MRIGIDMLAVQSPWTRGRGIGRLSHNLVAALLAQDAMNEYFLYGYRGLPTDHIPDSGRARVTLLQPGPQDGEKTLHETVDRLVRTNPDELDVYLVLSPMELWGGYALPAKPLNGLKVAAYVHDAIPFLFQEKYLPHPPSAEAAYLRLERLREYDVLLANSACTRADFRRLLGLPAHQVVTVHCAASSGCFRREGPGDDLEGARRILAEQGIDRPFVFNLGGVDEQNDRKNLFGVIDAFRLLPEPLRVAHQLVMTCAMPDQFANRLRRFAEERGVGEQLVLTNEVPDDTVRVLYQRCAAFLFPSLYEGFGLPLLEAMLCGAAVVAGDNSAQKEVVGDAGLLANAHDNVDIAEKLAHVLSDRAFARELGRRALEQACQFSWERTAQRTIEALAPVAAPSPAYRRHRARAPKPRIAVFAPFPPKISGISNYTTSLVHELRSTYTIDLYHDDGYVPELGLGSAEFGCFDHRLFDRRAPLMNYRALLYQMGNSQYHRFVYEALERHPGIVTLHDLNLAHFQWWCPIPDAPPDYLQRRVFERGRRVIVHSTWSREQVARLFPQHLEKTVVVPLGASAEIIAVERKARARARFGLPPEALLIGAVGHLTPGKMNLELVEAFAGLAGEFPGALLVFIGQDCDNGASRRKAETLGIATRVRLLGRQESPQYEDLIATLDVGVCLRSPPTNGETSAALLDLMRLGVPTIVTDVGTFSAYSDAVVRKVRWPDEGLDGLTRALRELAADPAHREALGRAAWSHVAQEHAWYRAAGQYVEVIENCHAGRAQPHGENVPLRFSLGGAA